MGALIFRRLLSIIPLLLLVSFGVFMLVALVPGDAAVTLAGGENATPERIAAVRAQLHLDDPLVEQYGRWLGDAVQGDLGESLFTHVPLTDDLVDRLPITIGLVLAALVVGLVIGVPVGVLSALRAGRALDGAARVGTSVALAVPSYWLAIELVVVFAVTWHLLPPSGYVKFTTDPWEWLRHILLPAIALGLWSAASLARQLRASLIDALDSRYVRTAWAKGAGTGRVVMKHTMKNAAIPVVTVLGLQIGFMLGGTVLIEQIFSIPGIGPYFIRAVTSFDVPVIQGVAIVFVFITVGLSLIVDICYGLLDPASAGAMIGIDPTATDSAVPFAAAIEIPGPGAGARRGRVVRTMLRRPGVVLGLAFLALVLVCALFGPLIEPYNPNAIDVLHRNATPSWAHWLGTDDLGRDILSRIIAGASIAVRVSLQSVGIAFLVALPIGLFSAYRGGTADLVIMRFVDAGLSFPALVLAMAVAGVLGPSVGHAAIAISITMVPGFIRLVRGSALAVKHETYVDASRAIGTGTPTILLRRILPNVRSPLIVAASLALGGALLAEAGLSFLGLSVQPPDASWGSMLRHAYDVSLFTYPWQIVIPGAAIALTILAFNVVGDGLRDALSVGSPAVRPRRARGARRERTRRGLTYVEPAVVAVERTAPDAAVDEALLAVTGLTVEFGSGASAVRAVDDVSFAVQPSEILGLVGESGSGKTVTSLAIMRLLDSPPARIVSGSVCFEQRDILQMSFDDVRRLRGASMAMVFQDPMSSLNPAFTVQDQLVEAYRLHRSATRAEARARAREMLDLVQIPAAAARLTDYPHQLSGGMRQRVMLAMALICNPKLLIADEPTTALDVTVQAEILVLLRSLQRDLDLSVVLVTHDLGVVADACDRVAVMYAGQIVEQSPVGSLFVHPRHPYTEGLLRSMPRIGDRRDSLFVIDGVVPSPDAMPAGCRFHPRCSYALPECAAAPVALTEVGESLTRCLRSADVMRGGSR